VPPRRHALVFITDPERLPVPQADHLRQLYGLTRMEASVAVSALRGEGLQAIADELGISPTTARTHLQHVFEKTGTCRQAELVRLILQSGLGAIEL
jgi:DNA-binding CsgD family transcriptional regulator